MGGKLFTFKDVECVHSRLSSLFVGAQLCAGERVWNQANACASALIYPEAEVNDNVPLCLVFFSL